VSPAVPAQLQALLLPWLLFQPLLLEEERVVVEEEA
jgi:hypothetical protein